MCRGARKGKGCTLPAPKVGIRLAGPFIILQDGPYENLIASADSIRMVAITYCRNFLRPFHQLERNDLRQPLQKSVRVYCVYSAHLYRRQTCIVRAAFAV